jgi:hypothetical protein
MWDEIVSRLANQLGAELLVAEARRAATATLETEICGQRLSTARTANEPHRWCNRLGRPTDAAASRGNVVLFCGLGITSICADSLVELRGFELMITSRCVRNSGRKGLVTL